MLRDVGVPAELRLHPRSLKMAEHGVTTATPHLSRREAERSSENPNEMRGIRKSAFLRYFGYGVG